MKIQIVGLLALGLLVTAQPGVFAQTRTTPSTTTNPRSNPANDQSGPTDEDRTDSTPDASTPGAERGKSEDRMNKGTSGTRGTGSMSKPKSGDSMNKPRSSSMQGGMMNNSKSNMSPDITNTTNLPESKSRPDDALLVDPPSGVSNNDPNLKPRTTTQSPSTTRPK